MDPTDGLLKLQSFCAIACEQGYLWGWSDTCCIDKDSTVELARAIASMFSWYRRSALTIVYLADVSGDGILSTSDWFKRGWTLQELLASRKVLFYTQGWSLYKGLSSSNHKEDDVVLNELEDTTRIGPRYLNDFKPGLDSARLRLQSASERRTTQPEDVAYSLFGIFGISLPIIPGESAENALGRLLTEIISKSGDVSVLDWVGEASSFHSCFPARIASYQSIPYSPSTPRSDELPISGIHAPVAARIKLLDSLSTLDPPHFIGHRLRLPCIAYRVTAVQLQLLDSSASKHVYEIQAEGLNAFEITLTSNLPNTSRSTLPYVLIRPWHPRLLDLSTELDDMAADKLVTMLGQPISALLLEEVFRNEYKRIASSSVIVVRPTDATSMLKSKVQTLDIV